MTLATLAAAAERVGRPLDAAQIDRFARYRELLLDWNTRINLTAIEDPDAVEALHFVDSIAGLAALPADEGLHVVDVGTGGGLPGLALRIARPDLRLTLLDSVRKKTNVLSEICRDLGLDDVELLTARAEDVGQDNDRRESWDAAVNRAIGSVILVAELCLPLVRVGGVVVSWKKRDVGDEILVAGRGISILGGRRLPSLPVDLPGLPPDRQLVRMVKERRTPDKYPRLPGTPKMKPLV